MIAALVTLMGLTGAVIEHSRRVGAEAQPLASVSAAAIGYDVAVDGLPTMAESVDLNRLADSEGMGLLERLALLDPLTLAGFVIEHPSSIDALVVQPPAATEVRDWWAALDTSARRTLIDGAPRLVGNLPGLPYPVRDNANRDFLDNTISTLETTLADGAGRSISGEERAQLGMLRQVALSLEEGGVGPARSLVSLDVEWPGRAAVALGSLATADNVSYLVPGMFFTVDGQIVDWTEIALNLHSEQVDLLDSMRKSGTIDTLPTVATVAWMGYETPNIFTVASLDKAYEGATYLENAILGLEAVTRGHRPHVSLLTHSYGSTAASIALSRGVISVDAMAIVGSPGLTVDRAGDLAVPRGQVYVGEASWDPVVDTAFHGIDPGSESFGAKIMSVAGGTDAITGSVLAAASGHNGYFTPGTESMRNLALIALGRGELVSGVGGTTLLAAGQAHGERIAEHG